MDPQIRLNENWPIPEQQGALQEWLQMMVPRVELNINFEKFCNDSTKANEGLLSLCIRISKRASNYYYPLNL